MAHLDFEKPIVELEDRIRELRLYGQRESGLEEELQRLEARAQDLSREIYAELTIWQKVQLSRHADRPYFLDYVERLFDDVLELHGDRSFSDDPAIIAGFARLDGKTVAIIGHQKGRTTKEKLRRNFGMAHPEGYRKAMRIMELAHRFKRPIFTFIDTPGAYPGIGAEERGQSEAIGKSLLVMSQLGVPVIATVIGEGGSGGALAIAVADCVLMLQYAVYSVISPEGCAAILWKSADKAPEAAETLGITAHRLKALGLIDRIVNEPLGGAHRDTAQMGQLLKRALGEALRQFQNVKPDDLIATRQQRIMAYGKFKELG